ncbi:MAG: lipid-binding SYLF domain-containing protein [Phycisphaerae bacterium]|nr:lipid-binding SYLF domain-containing protein [Phycisphaerae bacterium]
MNTRPFALAASLLLGVAAVTGCSSDGSSSSGSSSNSSTDDGLTMDQRANNTVSQFRAEDPSLSKFFDSAAGYAVFPRIATGAFIVGGSNGHGVLFEGGRIIGDVEVTGGSIGLQAGGQTFSQIIFFRTSQELNRFKSGNFEFDGRASAVAVRAGGAATADYTNGVAVFAFNPTGLMAQASIGGQKFSFRQR